MKCPVCDCDLTPYMGGEVYSPKFLETLADIAYLAGARRYHSGDSRADVQRFIAWAEEFESNFTKKDDERFTYMEKIEEFTNDKLINSGHLPLPGGDL